MKYIILETTDNKYEGARFEIESLPKIGEYFQFRDIEFRVKDIRLSEDVLIVYSDNYIIKIKKDI